MEIQIRRIDKELPLPAYKTQGAVALDCAAREDITVAPQSLGYIPLNFALKLPKGYWVLMAPRGSLHKRGLLLPNSIGVFDEDFSGNDDEYVAVVYNFTQEAVEIKRGERITQIIVLPHSRVEWKEVETLDDISRGGFGTTGK